MAATDSVLFDIKTGFHVHNQPYMWFSGKSNFGDPDAWKSCARIYLVGYVPSGNVTVEKFSYGGNSLMTYNIIQKKLVENSEKPCYFVKNFFYVCDYRRLKLNTSNIGDFQVRVNGLPVSTFYSEYQVNSIDRLVTKLESPFRHRMLGMKELQQNINMDAFFGFYNAERNVNITFRSLQYNSKQDGSTPIPSNILENDIFWYSVFSRKSERVAFPASTFGSGGEKSLDTLYKLLVNISDAEKCNGVSAFDKDVFEKIPHSMKYPSAAAICLESRMLDSRIRWIIVPMIATIAGTRNDFTCLFDKKTRQVELLCSTTNFRCKGAIENLFRHRLSVLLRVPCAVYGWKIKTTVPEDFSALKDLTPGDLKKFMLWFVYVKVINIGSDVDVDDLIAAFSSNAAKFKDFIVNFEGLVKYYALQYFRRKSIINYRTDPHSIISNYINDYVSDNCDDEFHLSDRLIGYKSRRMFGIPTYYFRCVPDIVRGVDTVSQFKLVFPFGLPKKASSSFISSDIGRYEKTLALRAFFKGYNILAKMVMFIMKIAYMIVLGVLVGGVVSGSVMTLINLFDDEPFDSTQESGTGLSESKNTGDTFDHTALENFIAAIGATIDEFAVLWKAYRDALAYGITKVVKDDNGNYSTTMTAADIAAWREAHKEDTVSACDDDCVKKKSIDYYKANIDRLNALAVKLGFESFSDFVTKFTEYSAITGSTAESWDSFFHYPPASYVDGAPMNEQIPSHQSTVLNPDGTRTTTTMRVFVDRFGNKVTIIEVQHISSNGHVLSSTCERKDEYKTDEHGVNWPGDKVHIRYVRGVHQFPRTNESGTDSDGNTGTRFGETFSINGFSATVSSQAQLEKIETKTGTDEMLKFDSDKASVSETRLSNGNVETTTTFYDDKGRIIRTVVVVTDRDGRIISQEDSKYVYPNAESNDGRYLSAHSFTTYHDKPPYHEKTQTFETFNDKGQMLTYTTIETELKTMKSVKTIKTFTDIDNCTADGCKTNDDNRPYRKTVITTVYETGKDGVTHKKIHTQRFSNNGTSSGETEDWMYGNPTYGDWQSSGGWGNHSGEPTRAVPVTCTADSQGRESACSGVEVEGEGENREFVRVTITYNYDVNPPTKTETRTYRTHTETYTYTGTTTLIPASDAWSEPSIVQTSNSGYSALNDISLTSLFGWYPSWLTSSFLGNPTLHAKECNDVTLPNGAEAKVCYEVVSDSNGGFKLVVTVSAGDTENIYSFGPSSSTVSERHSNHVPASSSTFFSEGNFTHRSTNSGWEMEQLHPTAEEKTGKAICGLPTVLSPSETVTVCFTWKQDESTPSKGWIKETSTTTVFTSSAGVKTSTQSFVQQSEFGSRSSDTLSGSHKTTTTTSTDSLEYESMSDEYVDSKGHTVITLTELYSITTPGVGTAPSTTTFYKKTTHTVKDGVTVISQEISNSKSSTANGNFVVYFYSFAEMEKIGGVNVLVTHTVEDESPTRRVRTKSYTVNGVTTTERRVDTRASETADFVNDEDQYSVTIDYMEGTIPYSFTIKKKPPPSTGSFDIFQNKPAVAEGVTNPITWTPATTTTETSTWNSNHHFKIVLEKTGTLRFDVTSEGQSQVSLTSVYSGGTANPAETLHNITPITSTSSIGDKIKNPADARRLVGKHLTSNTSIADAPGTMVSDTNTPDDKDSSKIAVHGNDESFIAFVIRVAGDGVGKVRDGVVKLFGQTGEGSIWDFLFGWSTEIKKWIDTAGDDIKEEYEKIINSIKKGMVDAAYYLDKLFSKLFKTDRLTDGNTVTTESSRGDKIATSAFTITAFTAAGGFSAFFIGKIDELVKRMTYFFENEAETMIVENDKVQKALDYLSSTDDNASALFTSEKYKVPFRYKVLNFYTFRQIHFI